MSVTAHYGLEEQLCTCAGHITQAAISMGIHSEISRRGVRYEYCTSSEEKAGSLTITCLVCCIHPDRDHSPTVFTDRSQVIITVNVRTAVLWDVALCVLVQMVTSVWEEHPAFMFRTAWREKSSLNNTIQEVLYRVFHSSGIQPFMLAYHPISLQLCPPQKLLIYKLNHTQSVIYI
jgi:hypothetical protein